jgi:hypothetical protein
LDGPSICLYLHDQIRAAAQQLGDRSQFVGCRGIATGSVVATPVVDHLRIEAEADAVPDEVEVDEESRLRHEHIVIGPRRRNTQRSDTEQEAPSAKIDHSPLFMMIVTAMMTAAVTSTATQNSPICTVTSST